MRGLLSQPKRNRSEPGAARRSAIGLLSEDVRFGSIPVTDGQSTSVPRAPQETRQLKMSAVPGYLRVFPPHTAVWHPLQLICRSSRQNGHRQPVWSISEAANVREVALFPRDLHRLAP